MDKQKQRFGRVTLRGAVCFGLLLLALVAVLAGHWEVHTTAAMAEHTMQTIKQQCASFRKLTASDRTKSLFRLSDLLRELSEDLERDPGLVSDAALEDYVDGLRLSGVAVLDEELHLEASGHTRRFRDGALETSPDGSRFADIVTSPEKVYAERLQVKGEFYDVCAVARQDAPGILIGYYHQPSGLITDTEKDLEQMLTGLNLDRGGHYAVVEQGTVRVSSDAAIAGAQVADTPVLQGVSQVPKDTKLHLFRADGRSYWGYRSGYEDYSLYLYYPLFTVFSSAVLAAALFAAGYSLLLALLFAVQHRTMAQRQEELRQSNQNLEETVKMLRSLETIYFCLFYVDLDGDSYHTLYIAPWLADRIPDSGRYTALKESFLSGFVMPAFRSDIEQRMSIDSIRETLDRKNITELRKSFYTDYQAIRGNETPWCRLTATVVDYNADGTPHHVLALVQDIDREKAREADYQAQILKEAHAAKVANNAKSEFLRRISHDIRTPINGVQGYIELGAAHPENMDLQTHCREKAKAALHTLLELVNSVLDMSKLESGEILLEDKPFDLSVLLDEINTILAPQAAAKGVTYEVIRKGPLPVPDLIGSPRHLSQIILNITANAVKYTAPGGYVHVNTHLVSLDADTVTYAFICEDNGVGMSREFQAHLFEPFCQEKKTARTTYEGAGLGLAIVKRLTDAMGGVITCRSEKGVGTSFYLQMTFRIDPAQNTAEAEEALFGAALAGRHILLAEDNELNMEIAEFLLTEHGAQVTKAWNGQEAVEQFAASAPGEFDLVLMDIMMPVMDGLEATRAIRRMDRPDAKTVLISAMSANSFADDIQRSLEAGMNEHISKPVDEKKMIVAVSQLLAQRE